MPSKQRNQSLEGLRALAIIAIVVYHADPNWLPGGFVGVTVFFVLTGYLTTLSVARRLAGKGGFGYAAYVKERAARLWPTMLAVFAATAVLAWTVAPALLPKLKADAAPALLFVQNIHYIVRQVSYFDAAGQPSPLTHFWYVGVVMQFYLVWPLVLAATWRRGTTRRRLCAGTLALMVASAVAMAALFDPAQGTSRIYYGLDTRACELLAGSLAALATMGAGLDAKTTLMPKALQKRLAGAMGAAGAKGDEKRPASGASTYAYDLIGVACLAGLVAFAFCADGYSAFAYRGGIAAMAVLSALLVGVICRHQPTILARVLAARPLAALGRRSFAIYLWHYPLLLVMNPATRTTELPAWGWALEVVAILGVSGLSWRLLERPGAPTLALNARGRKLAVGPRQVAALAGVACAAAVLALPVGPIEGQRPQTDGLSPEERKAAAEAAAAAREAAKSQTFDISGTYFVGTSFADAVDSINATNYQVDSQTGATDAAVVLIGDSVPEDASSEFYEIFPNGYMDAKIGRQLTAGVEAYRATQEAGHEGDIVVWSLADNGYVTEEQVKGLVEAVDPAKKVYLVTCRCPEPWQDTNNQVLHTVADQYDNVGIIDWFAESEGHDEYFWNDGTHVRPEGADAYVMMLRRAVTGR